MNAAPANARSLSRYFIDRPILAWVVAAIIMLAGALSITRLPISRYPDIAPPTVQINAAYPGASAQAAEDSVAQIIEQNMTGLDHLLYMQTTSSNDGSVSIVLTFATGTNPDIAQVQAQNRLQQAMPLLPQVVQQQGISVRKSTGGTLMAIAMTSDDPRMTASDMADYVATNMVDPLSRVEGVGSSTLFGDKYAMRIWLDPNKLLSYKLTPADVITAIQGQNAQLSVGQVGGAPATANQSINVTVNALGRLRTPEQFRNIVVKGNPDGSVLRLGDVGRVELGQASYGFALELNGQPAAGLRISLASGANALQTVRGVNDLLDKLRPTFPAGMKASVSFDTSPFVVRSIKEVIKTLVIAIVLVVLVMWLFLQNLRATLIPALAVPVVLLGTFAVLALFGYSINMLTMFALVLAIGLLVDDAIVVVENVERLIETENLSPIEATRKSMDQITGALIGIATVLSAVFIPMAFLPGSSGVIYRQFSVTIVSAMVLSVVVAIVLTPALCAAILPSKEVKEKQSIGRFFVWFNRNFQAATLRYQSAVAFIVSRPARFFVIYLALASLMGLLFVRLPTSYLPDEDQGYLFVIAQGPVGSTLKNTQAALKQVQNYFLTQEKETVERVFTVGGFSFQGQGQANGLGFVKLNDWDERPLPSQTVKAMQMRAMKFLHGIKEANVYAFAPPPVTDLGLSAGFDMHLRDDQGKGHDALVAARNQFLGMAAKDKLLSNVRPNGQEDGPQLQLDIDAQKVTALGLKMTDVDDALAVAWGGRYIDDFIDRGRIKRVLVQADAPYRMQPEDFGRWYVRNAEGGMVPVSAFATTRWVYGPPQLERFNDASSMLINGEASELASSGEAMDEVQKLVKQLPPGFSVDWSGQAYQERNAGSQVPLLYTVSIFVIFLCLAALYESWSIPTAILCAVPLGVIGAVIASSVRGFDRDIYFQVAMLTTIGLACKNAILIVEFAKEYVEAGHNVITAVLNAVHDRLRPILMTSLAFGLGVLPLTVATGAGAGAQRAIGTGVFGGMVAGTFLGIFFIPLFFVLMQRLFHGAKVHHTEEGST